MSDRYYAPPLTADVRGFVPNLGLLQNLGVRGDNGRLSDLGLLGWTPAQLFGPTDVGLWYDYAAITPEMLAWRRNLLTYSEELDNAAWSATANNTSVTANQGIAPNGTTTADLLASNTTNAVHSITRNANVNVVAGLTYTFSVYLKKGSGATAPDIMQLSFNGLAFGAVQYANFNITAGTVGATAGGIVASISDTGSGWFRCVVTAVATTSSTTSNAIGIIFTNNNDSLGRAPAYVDATTSNVLVWGAQFEQSSSVTAYQRITDFTSDFVAAFPTTAIYQDSTGVTPVTALGQPVGLVLDKARGGLDNAGPQLVTNGDFSGGTTGWQPASWVIAGGQATATATSTSLLNNTFTPVAGRLYQVNFTMVSYTSGTLAITVGGNFTGNVNLTGSAAAAGPKTVYVVAGSSPSRGVEFYGGTITCTIDNISVREVPGNHAIQSTPTARPVWDARKNLLLRTEEFENAAWSKLAATVTANSTLAPNGTTTADTVTATGNFANVSQDVAVVAGTVLTMSYWIAKTSGLADGSYPTVSIEYRTTTAVLSEEAIVVNTNTGTGVNNSGWGTRNPASFTVTGDGNYWRVTITTQAAPATSTIGRVYIGVSGGFANGTRRTVAFPLTSIVVWGAQVELGSTATSYQRVTTATDYADVGFSRGALFDGSDDFLVTAANLNLSGTDEVTVIVGLDKRADVTASVVELSASVDANNSAFAVFAPSSTGGLNTRVFSKGTVSVGVGGAGNFAPPRVGVVTGLADISSPLVQLRIDGALSAQSTASQGTGNYGSYPLYLGRRGGTAFPFNGRITQLIIIGRLLTTAELAQVERYVANQSGVLIP